MGDALMPNIHEFWKVGGEPDSIKGERDLELIFNQVSEEKMGPVREALKNTGARFIYGVLGGMHDV